MDTMIAHHALFNTLPKGLDFLSSMYAHDHVYWKGESKDWDPKLGERQLWIYNCKDAGITYECADAIRSAAQAMGMEEHLEFQHRLFAPVLYMMLKGCRIDREARKSLASELFDAAAIRSRELEQLVGHPLNPKSPPQMKQFFYGDMAQPPIKKPGTGEVTCDVKALETIATREPFLQPVVARILALRSLGVFLSTFINAPLDNDERMRCSFNIAGTSTYRFSSSTNAFGSGANLQTIPKGAKRGKDDPYYLPLPNVRKLFIPDPGYTIADIDLDRADLQVVVWEADDADLKAALRMGVDMHLFNAAAIWGLDLPVDELVESHPRCAEHKHRWAAKRHLAKSGVHATNYGVGDSKLAATLGITQYEAGKFRKAWFGAHPGVKRWQDRTAEMLKAGCISNVFGAKWRVVDRTGGLLPEALAWQPQSVVSRVINTILIRLFEQAYDVQPLLQVHDSLVFQFPTHLRGPCLRQVAELSSVVIPYADPLVIPTGVKVSEKSWGDCK